MKKFRGFTKDLKPLLVFPLDVEDELSNLRSVLKELSHPVILQLSLDKKEVFSYLSQFIEEFQNNENVWFGFIPPSGFEETKIEKIIQAYEIVRAKSSNKIVIESFRTDATC